MIGQLKGLPQSFAQNAETIFIHKELYLDEFPSSTRAAFGICSAYLLINDGNKFMIFRGLEAEASGLFQPVLNGTLLEELSRLQALVLYQTIRMYHGRTVRRLSCNLGTSAPASRRYRASRRRDDLEKLDAGGEYPPHCDDKLHALCHLLSLQAWSMYRFSNLVYFASLGCSGTMDLVS